MSNDDVKKDDDPISVLDTLEDVLEERSIKSDRRTNDSDKDYLKNQEDRRSGKDRRE
jgi:hypothetical protein